MNGTLLRRRLPTAVFLFVCVALPCVEASAFAQSGSARGAPALVPEEPPITSRPLAAIPPPLPVAGTGTSLDVALITIAVAIVLLIAAFAAATWRSRRTRPIPPLMRRAGEEFVAAFARPLLDASSRVPPIRARLKFVRGKRQLEISIAPGPGRRYPNLVDHKSNVEYDVTRVLQLLGAQFEMSDRLRTAGKWVVVPIRVADLNQTGLK